MGEPVLLRGAPIAQRIRDEVAADVAELIARNIHPHLAFIRPATDGGAGAYAQSLRRSCEKTGIVYSEHLLPEPHRQQDLLDVIDRLRDDPHVTGVILHAPLSAPFDEAGARERLGADLDVEGLHPEALGRLVRGAPRLVPCTAAAAWELLKVSGAPLAGRHLVIVGRSPSVGRALALLVLMEKQAPSVTVCHSVTADLPSLTRSADFLVVATGTPSLIRGEMVRAGAVVIDVGTNMVMGADGQEYLTGDVEFSSVAPRCSVITPVPGGVGPMTAALLLRNVVESARLQFPG